MKVALVCIIVLVAAATAFAYGQATVVSTGVTAVVSTGVTAVVADTWAEPAALLLSGTALLGIAGAVRRMPF